MDFSTLESMFGLPPGVLNAVMQTESNGNPKAVGPVTRTGERALGAFQIMPATAKQYGVNNPFDPEEAAYGAARILSDNLRQTGDPVKAVAAYNAGTRAVKKYGDVPPYPETQDYVNKVAAKMPSELQPAEVNPADVKWDDSASPNPGAVKWDDAPKAFTKAAPADTQPDWQAPNTGLTGRMLMGVGDFLRPATRAVVSGLAGGAEQLAPGSDFAKQAREAVGQIDAQTASQNAKFAEKQQAEGKVVPGRDWVRTAAGVAPAFLVPGGAAETIGGRVLTGMGQGAVLGAGATEDGQSYAKNAALGAVTGGAGAGLADVAGRVIRGANLSPEVRTLVDQGVTPTPGQALGGFVNTTEQRLSSVPLAGDAVTAARRGAVTDMNRALYQQVLDPVGEQAPKAVGRDAVEEIGNTLSQRYDALLPQMSMRADQQFGQDMQQLVPQFGKLPADMRDTFNSILDDNILTQTSKNGVLNGTDLKAAESALGQEAKTYARSSAPNDQRMAQLLRDTQTVLRQTLARQNPNQAPELQALNTAYGRYSVLRNAAARVNNPDSPIMPGQLQAAIKAGDGTVQKRAFGAGNARLQAELGDPAVKVLGNSVPDSGTAARAFLTHSLAGALGGSMVAHPGIGLGMGALAAAYGTPLGRQAMFAAIARRPELARMLGGAMQGVAPQIGGAAALYGVNGQGQ
jgi:hypothetical protein